MIWHQWGHTFYDYVHSNRLMTEPQKTLRSLGLIKGNGWNYLSSLSMRMANEDTDMRSDHLEDFLEEGGLWFLPRYWQDVDETSDISDFHAFGVGVLKRVQFEFQRFYLLGLGAYVLTFTFLVVLQRVVGIGKNSKNSKISISLRFLSRIAITHGFIAFLAWFALITVEDSHWARSIRSRKLFRIPVADVNDPAPSTVPDRDDILFDKHYSSNYLASYGRILDFAHPGNKYWRETTEMYADQYAALTPSLQQNFCAMLVSVVREERRFLKQDEERFWTEVVEADELVTACHRDLITASDPLLEAMMRQIDALQGDTVFGKFRETAMQTIVMPSYIRKWGNHLLQYSSREGATPRTFSMKSELPERPKNRLGNEIYSPAKIEPVTTRRDSEFPFRTPTMPEQPPREEPYEGAWLQEGDRAVGMFRCNEDSK